MIYDTRNAVLAKAAFLRRLFVIQVGLPAIVSGHYVQLLS